MSARIAIRVMSSSPQYANAPSLMNHPCYRQNPNFGFNRFLPHFPDPAHGSSMLRYFGSLFFAAVGESSIILPFRRPLRGGVPGLDPLELLAEIRLLRVQLDGLLLRGNGLL